MYGRVGKTFIWADAWIDQICSIPVRTARDMCVSRSRVLANWYPNIEISGRTEALPPLSRRSLYLGPEDFMQNGPLESTATSIPFSNVVDKTATAKTFFLNSKFQRDLAPPPGPSRFARAFLFASRICFFFKYAGFSPT